MRHRFRSRTAKVSTLVVTSVIVGMTMTPASAKTLPPKDPNTKTISLSFADGDTVSEAIQSAVDEYGRETVSGVLDKLTSNAEAGHSVGFPGVDKQSAADSLAKISEAVSADTEIPPSVGDEVIAPVDPGSTAPATLDVQGFAASSGGSGGKLVTAFSRSVPTIVPMVSGPTATTPGHYLEYGSAIANNRAWQWIAGFNVFKCGTTCILTDRREIRTTITPYQYRVRVDQTTIYSPNNGGISTPQITGRVYIPSAPARGSNQRSVSGALTWYIETPNLWTNGTRIVIGIEQRADARGGEQRGAYRTLTATCFPPSKSYCAWWV